jgi:hypothetical protein
MPLDLRWSSIRLLTPTTARDLPRATPDLPAHALNPGDTFLAELPTCIGRSPVPVVIHDDLLPYGSAIFYGRAGIDWEEVPARGRQ